MEMREKNDGTDAKKPRSFTNAKKSLLTDARCSAILFLSHMIQFLKNGGAHDRATAFRGTQSPMRLPAV